MKVDISKHGNIEVGDFIYTGAYIYRIANTESSNFEYVLIDLSDNVVDTSNVFSSIDNLMHDCFKGMSFRVIKSKNILLKEVEEEN